MAQTAAEVKAATQAKPMTAQPISQANKNTTDAQPKPGLTAAEVIAKRDKRNSDKIANFKKLAQKRTKNILKQLDVLSNCGNTNAYTYTQAQVDKIFGVIDEALSVCKAQFQPKEAKAEKNDFEL